MKANAHVLAYNTWMITNSASAHVSTWRNFHYQERCSEERMRRYSSNLIVYSWHENKGHAECQMEFQNWFHSKFSGPSPSGTQKVFWMRSNQFQNAQEHTWLVETKEQLLLAKLRWAK